MSLFTDIQHLLANDRIIILDQQRTAATLKGYLAELQQLTLRIGDASAEINILSTRISQIGEEVHRIDELLSGPKVVGIDVVPGSPTPQETTDGTH